MVPKLPSFRAVFRYQTAQQISDDSEAAHSVNILFHEKCDDIAHAMVLAREQWSRMATTELQPFMRRHFHRLLAITVMYV